MISIAVAKRSDAGALTALRSAVARDMTREFGEGHWSACPSRSQVLRQLRASHVLVAKHDDEIIGTVRLVRPVLGIFDSSSFTAVDRPLYVLGLAVAAECRGEGIGRLLMEAAKDRVRSSGAQALWLDAYEHRAGAGSFYAKCGFRKVGRVSGELPLGYFEWLAM